MNSVLLPIHIAAGGLALVLGALALSVKKGETVYRHFWRDVLLVVEGSPPSPFASDRPIRSHDTATPAQ
jgi:hypothetical protein